MKFKFKLATGRTEEAISTLNQLLGAPRFDFIASAYHANSSEASEVYCDCLSGATLKVFRRREDYQVEIFGEADAIRKSKDFLVLSKLNPITIN